MYGKHFSSMYTGSMVGAGFGAYAVMGYVIANQVPERKRPENGEEYNPKERRYEFYVELNPKVLATIFGESEDSIREAIDYLCAPDKESRTAAEDGRRLVRLGQYAYRVVNGALYHAIRTEEERREQNKAAQARFRNKRSSKRGKALAGEEAFLGMQRNGEDVSQEPGNKIPLP